ncbi:hypothetical protein KUTeg_012014 [Tegillarca granosa]|uniref:Uncharacterized protein n=1 Tax=Tegillarca granosa TaxID=220873 RepID=A0ABQ9EYB0_TEGGR|nr:hypothetical protein KUTeg_012014 [Tegillarca granosa]
MTDSDLYYIFILQLVICLMVPDILTLMLSLWQMVVYRRIRQHDYLPENSKDNDRALDSIITHICLEFLQCNAMYIFAFTVFPVLTPLEFCGFSAGFPVISCVAKLIKTKCDFSVKKTILYIIYAIIYVFGISITLFVIGYKTYILYGKSQLILTSICMLLFGLRWIPLQEKQQEKGISNFSNAISSLVRITTAVTLTIHFYPDAVSISNVVNDIIRYCGLQSTKEKISNQSYLQSFYNSSNSSDSIQEMANYIPYEFYVPFLMFIFTSFFSYHFATVACRLRMQQTSFAFPIAIAFPFYVGYLFLMEMGIITTNHNFVLVYRGQATETTAILLFCSFLFLWTCQLWSCRHVWNEQTEHLPATDRYVNYESCTIKLLKHNFVFEY